MGKLNGQLKIAGMGGVIGIDISSALLLAQILGFNKRMVVELLPFIEAGVVEAMDKSSDEVADLGEESGE